MKYTHLDGSIHWHTQGQPSSIGDFAYAVLYATPELGKRAKADTLRKYPGRSVLYSSIDIVPVTVEVQL